MTGLAQLTVTLSNQMKPIYLVGLWSVAILINYVVWKWPNEVHEVVLSDASVSVRDRPIPKGWSVVCTERGLRGVWNGTNTLWNPNGQTDAYLAYLAICGQLQLTPGRAVRQDDPVFRPCPDNSIAIH